MYKRNLDPDKVLPDPAEPNIDIIDVDPTYSDGVPSNDIMCNDVNFIDYDGTLLHSYSLDEVLQLNTLPAGPSHAGLVFKDWNWTLEDIKEMNQPMTVGATYQTDDGSTRIYIHLERGRLSPTLSFEMNGSVDIDWGDGSEHTISQPYATGLHSFQHSYNAAGNYVIRIIPNQYDNTDDGWNIHLPGTIGICGTNQESNLLTNDPNNASDPLNAIYRNAIYKVECGNRVQLKEYAFAQCYRISSVMVPYDYNYTVESYNVLYDAFFLTYSMQAIVIPSGITYAGDGGCMGVKYVSLPKTVSTLSIDAYNTTPSLRSICIPPAVTEIPNSVLYGSGITSFVVQDSVTKIGPLVLCSGLIQHVVIGSSVTRIEASAFKSCTGLAEVHMKPTTPPTLADSNVFKDLAADCVIYVPEESLDVYKTATNWAVFASQIQPEV